MYGSVRKTGLESPIQLHFFANITTNGLNISLPQNVKGASSLIPSHGRLAILCSWNLPLWCLHLRHFDIIDLTTVFNTMTRKPDILTWLIVMPAYASWSWHWLSNLWFCNPLAIACNVGFLANHFCILPPTFKGLPPLQNCFFAIK